jgi:hypothetical protein
MKLFRKKVKFTPLTSTIEEEENIREGLPPPPPVPSDDLSAPPPQSKEDDHKPIPPRPSKSPCTEPQSEDPTANLFEQKFVPEGHPKMGFHTKIIEYKYPSKRIQKKYGTGQRCAYCFATLVHEAPRSPKRPCLITKCYHICCADCITFNSRPLLENLDPATFRQHPFIFGRLSSAGMECPACNTAFNWCHVYNFYL